jgi:glycosyltransferase involved in cell wall biosynthesis
VKRPLVTIVIPVFNAELFLRETLESVLALDYSPTEVIVVDDSSTDRSVEIARSYQHVQCLTQEHLGGGAARNRGIWAAKGEFIANVDHDDLVPPWKLNVQVGYLLEHPNVDGVLGRQEWINPPPTLKRDLVYGDLDGIPCASIVVRTDVVRRLGGFVDDEGGDIGLLVKMREQGHSFVVLPELVLYRRYHGANWLAGTELTIPMPLSVLKAKLDRQRAVAAQGSAEV